MNYCCIEFVVIHRIIHPNPAWMKKMARILLIVSLPSFVVMTLLAWKTDRQRQATYEDVDSLKFIRKSSIAPNVVQILWFNKNAFTQPAAKRWKEGKRVGILWLRVRTRDRLHVCATKR